MAKIYKVTTYIIDSNDEIRDLGYLEDYVKDRLGSWVTVKVADSKESEEFEWQDELKINSIYSISEDYEEYFKENKTKGAR